MMHPRRANPRTAHRLQQSERVKASASLAEKFPSLAALKVDLAYRDAESLVRHSDLKYDVNVHHAKSFFCFMCPNGECVGGDFDLSVVLAQAIAKRKKIVSGELRCQGWHKSARVERTPCHLLLRYTLKLAYN